VNRVGNGFCLLLSLIIKTEKQQAEQAAEKVFILSF
jgi:hypothetical protein